MGIGLAGIEVYDLLRDEYDIQIEFGDICNILAYISIGDRKPLAGGAPISGHHHRNKGGFL